MSPATGPNRHNFFLFKPKIVNYINLLHYIANSPNKVYLRVELDLAVISIFGSSPADQVLLVKFPSESQVLVYGFATFHCASCEGSIYVSHLLFDSGATLYTQLPNMSQNSAAHLARVEHAVKTLLKAPNLTVPEAMYLAKFLEEDIANESI